MTDKIAIDRTFRKNPSKMRLTKIVSYSDTFTYSDTSRCTLKCIYKENMVLNLSKEPITMLQRSSICTHPTVTFPILVKKNIYTFIPLSKDFFTPSQ